MRAFRVVRAGSDNLARTYVHPTPYTRWLRRVPMNPVGVGCRAGADTEGYILASPTQSVRHAEVARWLVPGPAVVMRAENWPLDIDDRD